MIVLPSFPQRYEVIRDEQSGETVAIKFSEKNIFYVSNYRPTTLYIKEHCDTGMKYFGKTANYDATKYTGSGVYWKKHLREHGEHITTIWHEQFSSCEDLVEFATFFSDEMNIVASKDSNGKKMWANLQIEDGIGFGMPVGTKQPTRTAEHIKKLVAAVTGRTNTDEAKQLMSEVKLGRSWENQMGDDERAKTRRRECSVRNSDEGNPNALTWSIMSPSGEQFTVNGGLRKWCDDKGYKFGDVYTSSKGWITTKNGEGKGGPGRTKTK